MMKGIQFVTRLPANMYFPNYLFSLKTSIVRFAIILVVYFTLYVDGKVLTCDEYLEVAIVHEDDIRAKKCTFSFIEFDAFDDVNISLVIVKEIDYDNEENEVDLSNTIESVEFISSRFPHLPKELFARFVNLRSVSCDGVSMTTISRGDFKMASNLQEFSCNSNYITSLERMLFHGNTKLVSLDLSINDIESIDPSAFFGLEKLKKLLLYDNKLRNLSGDVFEDLISLEEINLSSNQLEFVDGKLFQNCKLLNYIYLNDNRIQQILDESFLGIEEIKFLELSNNELSEMSLNISASALYANHNRLSAVNLNSIGYMSFFNNSISQISFADKEGVISLNLSTNKLSSESLKSIIDLSEVKSLDLSFNKLGNLNVSTFLNMPLLQILNLQSSDLTEIGYGLFTHQTSLEQLDLSYNRLTTFDLSKLTAVKTLNTLFIEGNGISIIDHKSLKAILPELKLFGFSDNAWSCAYLSTLISFLEDSKIEIYNLVVDKTKSNVAGIGCLESGKLNEQKSYEDKSLSVNPIKHHQLHGSDDSNEMRAISEKFEAVLRRVNETGEKFVAKAELINELNMIKSALASLKQGVEEARKQSDKLTIADVKAIANKTMTMMMLQKSDDDARIIGLSAKVNTIEQSIDAMKDQLKALAKTNTERETQYAKSHFSKFQSESANMSETSSTSGSGGDVITKLMITIIFVVVCGFAIIYIARVYSNRKARKFISTRARCETESINENIL